MTDTEPRNVDVIRAELERLRALADNVPAMLAYWDRDQRCHYANRAYETWFGRKPSEVVGRTMAELLGELYAKNLPHITAALRGEEQVFDREIPDPAGGPPRQSQAHYVPDLVNGEVRGFYVLVTDVTHRTKAAESVRNVERQAHASERLGAIATLTQGIAHEINNPLAIALLGVDDALDQLDGVAADPIAMRESLVSAREGLNRMVGIVQSMQLLARLDTTEREQVDVKATLEQSIALATAEIRYRARLSSDLAHVGFIDVSGAQLSQVFVSLLLNVAKALPEEHSQRNEIRVVTRRNGTTIVIEISDNGQGETSELPQRVFDRFFTTDTTGGVGLGLSVARDIVTALGGAIHVSKPPSGGTLFRVTLPGAPEQLPLRAGAASTDSSAPLSAHRGIARRGRLLVVDDERLVGRSLKRHLSPRYDVETVTRGREAIELALREGYDVILCDLMMPDTSGAEVYAEVTAARPDLAERFIFMTGGAFTPRGREFLQSVAAPVLSKPFDLPLLDTTIRRVVDAVAARVTEATAAASRPGARD
jgi:PAS domain S-box-containing protein